MKSFLKVSAWFLYTLGMVLFFTYLLFPSESFRFFAEKELLRRTGAEVRMDGLSLGFPASLTLKGVRVDQEKGLRFFLEQVRLKPAFLALMTAQVGARVEVQGLGGRAEAGLKMPPTSPLKARGYLNLENLAMEALTDLLPEPPPLGIQGRLSGRFVCAPEEEGLGISGSLNLEGGELVLDFPMMDGLNLKLLTLQLESRVQEKNAEIKNLLLAGSFGTLQLQGAMGLPAGPASRLDLSGGIRPDPAFLQQLTRMGGIGPVIGRFVGQREIPVRVGGTLERPQVTLAGMRL
jgi:type II secretion system protein N